MSDSEALAEIFRVLNAAYRYTPPPPERIRAWSEIMEGLPFDAVLAVARRIPATFPKEMPPLGSIRLAVKHEMAETKRLSQGAPPGKRAVVVNQAGQAKYGKLWWQPDELRYYKARLPHGRGPGTELAELWVHYGMGDELEPEMRERERALRLAIGLPANAPRGGDDPVAFAATLAAG